MARNQALITQQREFLDDVSHQLRTHLTTLQMQVDYARREPNGDLVQQTPQALEPKFPAPPAARSNSWPWGAAMHNRPDFRALDLSAAQRSRWNCYPRLSKRSTLAFARLPVACHGVADAHPMHEALTNPGSQRYYLTQQGTVAWQQPGTKLAGALSVEEQRTRIDRVEQSYPGPTISNAGHRRRQLAGLGLSIARHRNNGMGARYACKTGKVAKAWLAPGV